MYVSSIDETRAKNIEDSCLEMIDKSDFIDEIKFYSTGELVKIFKNDSGIKRITLADQETRQKDLFEYSSKNGEIKAIVKNISGYDLVKQFSDESSFEANVRIYVGDKGINKKMRETASEEPDMFWFYNNGITIICRDIKDPTGNKGFYTLEGAQVVNGAQTINSLKKLRTSEEKLKNIRVLAKILKIPEKDESIFRKIVEFNNKQNKIDNWQFQSNKPFWKQLRIALLEKSGHSLDLIYKVGLPKRDGAKEIKLKEFVLVNIAYSGHPYLAKQGQAAVFKNVDDENEKNSYYYQIFPKEKLEIENVNEITPADIDRYYYTLLIYLDPKKILDMIVKLKLEEKEKSKTLQGIDTVMKHSKYYLLYILKKCRPKDTDEITFLKQINDNLPAFFTECVESIFIPIWEEEIRNDKTLISNAPRFTKNQKLLEKIDDKFKRNKFNIANVLQTEKPQLI